MKRFALVAAALLGLTSLSFGGDVATLVNLGFSADSAYFMFGFYGLDLGAGKPYAEIYVVDTKRNDFVRDGVHKGLYAVDLEPGWNPSGAFFKLFTGASSAAGRYKIDHLQQGRLIYLSVNGEEGEDALSFRDYKTQDQWELKLDQKAVEKDGVTSSSFGIELAFTSAAGKKSAIKIGNPQIERRNVLSYAMRQVIVAPDGKTVVILVERRERIGQATGLRYMVETFKLP